MCTTHGQAILLLHEICGINEFIHSVRKKLEQRGFGVFCPNMTAIQPFAYEERQKAYKYFMAHVGFDIYRNIGARIRQLKAIHKTVFVVGFSVGATIAWRLCENTDSDGIVACYGSRIILIFCCNVEIITIQRCDSFFLNVGILHEYVYFARPAEAIQSKWRSIMDAKIRCPWAGNTAIYVDYHDNEWGRPVHDDKKLFEMLILECMQAGLSWITILKKREAFREAFDGFDPEKMALYGDTKIQQLMTNEGIVRNRLKILAAINNAQIFLDIAKKYGSFDDMLWKYVDHTPIVGHWEKMEDAPATTPLSDTISKDLKKEGFKFVGSTTLYAFMQAVGMVNDHITTCFIYKEALLSGQLD